MVHAIGVTALLAMSVGGYVAGSPLVSALLPVSPILLGALGTALLVAVRPVGEPIPLQRLGVVLLFGAGLVGGWAFATGSAYASDKGAHLATMVPLSMIGGVVLLRHRRARAWWVAATIGYAFLVSALILLAPDQVAAESSRLSLEGGNTIAAGRAPGAAVAALLTLAVARNRYRARLLLMAAALSIVLLATGSRGPLLAVIAAFALVVPLVPARSNGRPRWVWLGPAVAAVAGAGYWGVSHGFLADRLTTVTDGSALTRVALYEATWEEVGRHPFGAGWGYLEQVYANGHLAGFTYPHNILLETVVEAGWLGFAGLVAVLVMAWRTQRSRCEDPYELAMLALLVFFFISALVSGDLPSHRALWVMVGACATGPLLPTPRHSVAGDVSDARARRRSAGTRAR